MCFLSYNLWKRSINTKRKPQFSNHRTFWYISSIMPKVNCSVTGCSNSTYWLLTYWIGLGCSNQTCAEHNLEAEGNCKKKWDCLECKPPFHLHTFPVPIIRKQLREAWIKSVRRESFDKKGSWQPASSDWVCSIHFVDGLATFKNPIQTLFLGYESKEKKSRSTLLRKPLEKNVSEGNITSAASASQEEEVPLQTNFIDENLDITVKELNEPMEVIHEPIQIIPGDHSFCLPNNSTSCYTCQEKFNIVKALFSKINKLTLENKQLKHR